MRAALVQGSAAGPAAHQIRAQTSRPRRLGHSEQQAKEEQSVVRDASARPARPGQTSVALRRLARDGPAAKSTIATRSFSDFYGARTLAARGADAGARRICITGPTDEPDPPSDAAQALQEQKVTTRRAG